MPTKRDGASTADASVYARFTKTQKCWAHLPRKSVRICLLAPENPQFEILRDGLFEIYRSANRLKSDSRYSEDGRHNAMLKIQDTLHDLICPECEVHEGKRYEGARRRTIIVSTMESIRYYVKGYTLASITDELLSWQVKGISCFERELQSLKDGTRSIGILAKLYPTPQAG